MFKYLLLKDRGKGSVSTLTLLLTRVVLFWQLSPLDTYSESLGEKWHMEERWGAVREGGEAVDPLCQLA